MIPALMEQSDKIHNYIILEVTLRTIERDRKHLGGLKMHSVLEEWYDEKINQVFKEQKEVRDFLYKLGCKIDKLSTDEFATEYQILYRGRVETRRYGNIALRNWVSQEMRRLLGMPYITPEDSKSK